MINFKKIGWLIILVIIISFIIWLLTLYNVLRDNYGFKINKLSAEKSLIVVLTGGKGRIEKGIELLEKGKGKFLLISGVFEKEKVKNKYLSTENSETDCCIFFEEKSKNTLQNVNEVSKWLKSKDLNIDSIQIVTSYYHIPRSLIIFKKFFPQKKLITIPVKNRFGFSKEFFFHSKLIISEYFKIFFTIIYLL